MYIVRKKLSCAKMHMSAVERDFIFLRLIRYIHFCTK